MEHKNIEIKDLALRATPVTAEQLDKIYGGCLQIKTNAGLERV